MNTLQIIGFVFGLLSGVIWEKLATAKFGHFRTLFPSLFVSNGGTTIHLHHWLIYTIALIIILIWAYKTGRLLHPAILFIWSGLLGAIAFDIISFRDWYEFFVKS